MLPLNQEQISTYVADLGTNGQILAELLTREPKLVELAQTPLFLNIMALAAPEVIQQLSTGDTTTEDLREQVIDAFIRQMLMRSKAIRTHSSSEKTIRYLQFLGQNMQRLNISAIIPNWVSIFKFGDESYENFISTFRGLSLAYVLVSLLGLFTFFVMQNYPWPPVQNVALGTTTLLVLLMSIYYFVVPRVIRQRYKSEQFEVIRTQLLRTAQGKTVLVVSIVMAVAYTLMTYWSFTRLSYSVRAVVIIALPVYLFVLVIGLRESILPRAIMVLDGYLPWNVKRLLEDSVALKFMYRIGPGYTFIHRLVMEHFASLDPTRLNLEELDAEWERARRK